MAFAKLHSAYPLQHDYWSYTGRAKEHRTSNSHIPSDDLIGLIHSRSLSSTSPYVSEYHYCKSEEVAKEIAKRDIARIASKGVMALYLQGLTTQEPLKAVYLTDGSQREVKIGNRTIKFKLPNSLPLLK